jgi:hypothetical protein
VNSVEIRRMILAIWRAAEMRISDEFRHAGGVCAAEG